MAAPVVATLNTGIAHHFKWQVSPEDFEDSPRGPPPKPYFDDIETSPSTHTFCNYASEYSQPTFTTPSAQLQLPTLLTNLSPKYQMQNFVGHCTPGAFPEKTQFAQKQDPSCLLATGLSRMGDTPQVNASHRFVHGLQAPQCPAASVPVQTSVAHFPDYGSPDPCAEIWQEPLSCRGDAVLQSRMCNYCCVRPAICFSECEGNPEMYCDVCRPQGDERWRGYSVGLQNNAGDDNDSSSKRGEHTLAEALPANPAIELTACAQSDSSVLTTEKVDVRKKGRNKKAAKKVPESQAKGLTSDPVASGDWEDDTTTVMMRNIPSRYTVEELVSEMITMNFRDKFDYLYLPMDFKTKRNKGYAFINFVKPQHAVQFHTDFQGVQLPKYGTQKTLHIARAETQGLQANLEAAQKDKPRITNPWFRPMVFTPVQDTGA